MSGITASLNTKIDPAEKALFVKTAEEIGLSPSSVIRVFVRSFNERGGFPFPVQRNYPLGAEERQSIAELDRQLSNGTARRYGDFVEILAEVDAEIAAEDA
jgi:antitoxin component of RelBE/YafQ-DinJ toxin-antitoxin module